VLLGHWPLQGPGADDRYLVYENVFVDNSTEALFQAEGRLALYNNVFINPYGDGVHIQPHNDVPRDMDIFYNTVMARDAGIVIREKLSSTEHYSQRVVGNLIAAGKPLQGGTAAHNGTLPFQSALEKLYPAARLSAALLNAGHPKQKLPQASWAAFTSYPDWDSGRSDPAQVGAWGSRVNAGFEAYMSGR
jgi:hypothetical protein